MNVAEKVFRKVKTETSMPEEDLELSLDNVDKGELFAEAREFLEEGRESKSGLRRLFCHSRRSKLLPRLMCHGGGQGRSGGSTPGSAASRWLMFLLPLPVVTSLHSPRVSTGAFVCVFVFDFVYVCVRVFVCDLNSVF